MTDGSAGAPPRGSGSDAPGQLTGRVDDPPEAEEGPDSVAVLYALGITGLALISG